MKTLEEIEVRAVASGRGHRVAPQAQLHAEHGAEARGPEQIGGDVSSLDPSYGSVRQADELTQPSLAEVRAQPGATNLLADPSREMPAAPRAGVEQALRNRHRSIVGIADYRPRTGGLSDRHNGPMPEGDTIFRTAEVLRAALENRRILRARAQPQPGLRRVPDLGRLIGATVVTVEARGKHLLIGLDNGLTLRSHLRMSGSWHRYRPGERWRLPARHASAVLETAEAVAVAFNTPVVELLTDADLRRSRSLLQLGPDLLARSFDADEALRRLRELDSEEIGNALLDQRAVAGIGNVYKSEVAFVERLDPWAMVRAFDDAELLAALRTARRLLQANVRGGSRVTTGSPGRGQGLWVYGRAGRPCRRCGTPIRVRRQGDLARLTYWCPHCQPGAGAVG